MSEAGSAWPEIVLFILVVRHKPQFLRRKSVFLLNHLGPWIQDQLGSWIAFAGQVDRGSHEEIISSIGTLDLLQTIAKVKN